MAARDPEQIDRAVRAHLASVVSRLLVREVVPAARSAAGTAEGNAV